MHREVAAAGPDRGVVFQAPSLLPWLTARAERRARRRPRVSARDARPSARDIVDYYLARVGLAATRDKRAAELSNGMKQRVGIARAFALSPKLLLLDEPFGMLDSLTRWELQEAADGGVGAHARHRHLRHARRRRGDPARRPRRDDDERPARDASAASCDVDLPRPRTRKALLEHPDYYAYRQEILTFLASCEHGPAAPAASS